MFKRAWAFELHQFSSLVALSFIGLHMATLLPDQWTDFTPLDLFVPGTSAYRPAGVAVGVLAMYASVIGTVSFYVRKLLGHHTWRLLHYVTFVSFFLSLLHGVAAGTDSSAPWLQFIYAGSGLLACCLLLYRLVDVEVSTLRDAWQTRKDAAAASR